MVMSTLIWIIGAILLGRTFLAALPLGLYAIAASAIGLQMGKKQECKPHLVAYALSICHWCYGFGFWRGIFRIVTMRKFDAKPKGGRR
jgi:hypothetical protein